MSGQHVSARDSGNSTVWEEYVDIALVVANSLILLITSVVGIAANIFVILAVYYQKSLQNANNALVVNLAVIDLLRCAIDCPILLSIVIIVYQRGRVGDLICDTQLVSFSFSCCIQLVTLACISAERYQAIAQPFKASNRKRRIMVLIPLTWTLAIPVAVSCLIFLKDSPVHVRCQGRQRETSSSYDNFGLYMLFPLWAACFGVIIGFYARIFALVRSHNRKIFDRGAFPLSKKDTTDDKEKKEETTVVEDGREKSEQNLTLSVSVAQSQAEPNSSRKMSLTALLTSAKALQCVSLSSEKNKEVHDTLEIKDLKAEQPHPVAVQVAVKTEEKSNNVKSSTTHTCTQQVSGSLNTGNQSKERLKSDIATTETNPGVFPSAQSENPQSASALLIEPKQVKSSSGGETLAAAPPGEVSSLPPGSSNVPETEAVKQHVEVEGAVCMMPSKASRERASKNKESKMARRAGYIIVTFLFFWLPLITTILVNFVVHKNKNTQIMIMQDVGILSVSVACITSLSDPIIYAAVNPQFRTEFYRLKTRVKAMFDKSDNI